MKITQVHTQYQLDKDMPIKLQRIEFKGADNRVLFVVSITDDAEGLVVSAVDGRLPGNAMHIIPRAGNTVEVRTA